MKFYGDNQKLILMSTSSSAGVIKSLRELADPEKAAFLPKFFKTGPGEYGEGDKFLGVTVPIQRKVAKSYWRNIGKEELKILLSSEYHEVRMTGLFMLISKFEKAKESDEKSKWVDFYLQNRQGVNNWDLVDSSAPLILGAWLWDKDRSLLYSFAESGNLWDQRISILSTFFFIRKNDFEETLKLSEILLDHPHDLIHKAVGWMLREIGNRDYELEFQFLRQHYTNMPRTMLRYAIEKFEAETRELFLKGNI